MEIKIVNLEVTWRGTSPLLMNSNAVVNPFHEVTLKKKKLTVKRKKTEEDIKQLLDLDFEGGLYFDKDVGVYIPANNVEATIRNAGKKIRMGTQVKGCVICTPDLIPLIYEGPATVEGLLNDEKFRDVRPIVVQRASLLKCRPRFNNWQIKFNLSFDSNIIDDRVMFQILDIAGSQIGLCDYRPRYGRFEVRVTEI